MVRQKKYLLFFFCSAILPPCLRRLSPQYDRQSKFWCPNETIQKQPFSSQLTKTVHKFLWPLLVVNLSIAGLIWRGTAHFVQNNTTIILPSDTRRTTSQLPCRAPVTHFWRQNRSLETKMVHIFHFLPTSLVFEIVNPFSWIFNAISSDKSCLIATISTWRQDTRIFLACWILIGKFKFPARQPYARHRPSEQSIVPSLLSAEQKRSPHIPPESRAFKNRSPYISPTTRAEILLQSPHKVSVFLHISPPLPPPRGSRWQVHY